MSFSSSQHRVTPKEATKVVRTATRSCRLRCSKTRRRSGIPGDAKIDMSDYSGLYIADGVTIASSRGLNGAGALITYSSTGKDLFVASPKKLRVTGVRFKGPRTDFYDPGESGAIRDNTQCFDLMGGPVIIDNCEFYGWQKAAIHFQTDENIRSWIHHNYIHHNQMQHRGYGIDLITGQHLIEWNLFNANRHAIAGTGFPSVWVRGAIQRSRSENGLPTVRYALGGGSATRELRSATRGEIRPISIITSRSRPTRLQLVSGEFQQRNRPSIATGSLRSRPHGGSRWV